MIMPKKLWENVSVKELGAHPASRKPVGTGPWVLDSWTTNESIVAHAYPEYHEGRPNLDKLINLYVADQATGFNLLKSKEINVMGLYSSIAIDNVAEAKSDNRIETRGFPGLANMYAEINFRNPLFQDLRVRQAISYATDRKAIKDSLYKGLAVNINSPIHPSFWAAKADTTTYDNDLNKAKDLMAQAGWKMGSDGILEKDGQKFRFNVPSIQTATNPYDVVLQEQWKRVGIDAQIQRMDFASFWAPLYLQGKHDIAALNLPFGLYLDPDYPLSGYFASTLNRNKYNNPKVDELIKSSTATLDRDERKNRYFEFQETMAKDVPHLWLGVPDEVWGWTKGLNIPQKPNGYLTMRSTKDWYWES
jgi:peptide/nickel transport system substrate-binding protein